MIKINNVKFNIDKTTISWGSFLVSSKTSRKREGISPMINFYIVDDLNNKNILSIETIYPDTYFLSLKIGKQIDFTKYVSDILYTVNDFTDSLINSNYSSTLSRVDTNTYKIKIECNYNLDYTVDISLDENINLEVQNG